MATSQDIFGQIQNFDSTRKSASDIMGAAEGKYNIGQSRQRLVGLRSAIMGTEGLLNQVDPSVTGRTSGALVSEAQRSRMVANERAPIAEQYSQQQGALGNENANYGDLQSQAARDAQMQISDQESKRSALQSLYDSLYKKETDAATLAEQQRQFNEEQAASRRAEAAAKANNDYIASILRNNGGGGQVPQTPTGGDVSADQFDKPDPKAKPKTKAQKQATNRNMVKGAGAALLSTNPLVAPYAIGYGAYKAAPKVYNSGRNFIKNTFGI